MQEFILQENVLSDNILKVADEGKVFKGQYIAIVEEYKFQNEWCDTLDKVHRFRSMERLNKFLSNNYPNFSF